MTESEQLNRKDTMEYQETGEVEKRQIEDEGEERQRLREETLSTTVKHRKVLPFLALQRYHLLVYDFTDSHQGRPEIPPVCQKDGREVQQKETRHCFYSRRQSICTNPTNRSSSHRSSSSSMRCS